MTHASWNNERGRPSGPGHDNERLEYLGDAVLELVVGEYLFKRFPEYDEGQLTQLRAALVNTSTLARLAERLELGEALFMGKGAAKTGARQLPSLLANAFEAMIGAIFLDQGYRVATRVFLQNIGDLADWSDENFKGKLQEVAQERTGTTPTYRVVASGGPGHKREYTADAVVAGEVVGSGRGTTKQAAEQAAARSALQVLTRQPRKRAAAKSPASRAAGAARQAARATAAEPPRVRRRVAEVAADRSASHEERAAAAPPPPAPLFTEPIPAGSPPRRRGLLAALRSAAEALVGRVVTEVEPEPTPPPARRPRPAAPPVRDTVIPGDGTTARPRRPSASGRPASAGSAGQRPPQGGRTPAGGAASGAAGSARRRRPTGTGAGPTAGSPPRGTGAAPSGGRRPPGSGRPPVEAAGMPDGTRTGDPAEARRPTRRGRRGGRGRRRPGADGGAPEASGS
jgi:ribonuclease III